MVVGGGGQANSSSRFCAQWRSMEATLRARRGGWCVTVPPGPSGRSNCDLRPLSQPLTPTVNLNLSLAFRSLNKYSSLPRAVHSESVYLPRRQHPWMATTCSFSLMCFNRWDQPTISAPRLDGHSGCSAPRGGPAELPGFPVLSRTPTAALPSPAGFQPTCSISLPAPSGGSLRFTLLGIFPE